MNQERNALYFTGWGSAEIIYITTNEFCATMNIHVRRDCVDIGIETDITLTSL